MAKLKEFWTNNKKVITIVGSSIVAVGIIIGIILGIKKKNKTKK